MIIQFIGDDFEFGGIPVGTLRDDVLPSLRADLVEFMERDEDDNFVSVKEFNEIVDERDDALTEIEETKTESEKKLEILSEKISRLEKELAAA